jgi:hypothetical protein
MRHFTVQSVMSALRRHQPDRATSGHLLEARKGAKSTRSGRSTPLWLHHGFQGEFRAFNRWRLCEDRLGMSMPAYLIRVLDEQVFCTVPLELQAIRATSASSASPYKQVPAATSMAAMPATLRAETVSPAAMTPTSTAMIGETNAKLPALAGPRSRKSCM